MINRVGVCSWSLQPTSVSDLLVKLRSCSIKQTQIALNPLAADPDELQLIVQECENDQLELCSGMMETIGEDYSTIDSIKLTGGLRPDTHWDANQDVARRCANVANTLGLKLVTLHAGFIPEDDLALHHAMADRVCRIAEIFNEVGVTLGLETGQECAEPLLKFLSTIRSRCRVGVNFDPANMILYSMGEPIQAMHALKDHIVQVHLKDAVATDTPGTWGSEVIAGQGQVDWDGFFACVRSLPEPIDVLIEREAGGQRVDDIKAAHILAKRQIEKVSS
jgi:L-ribulose-5-phosphate 3-epimerase